MLDAISIIIISQIIIIAATYCLFLTVFILLNRQIKKFKKLINDFDYKYLQTEQESTHHTQFQQYVAHPSNQVQPTVNIPLSQQQSRTLPTPYVNASFLQQGTRAWVP